MTCKINDYIRLQNQQLDLKLNEITITNLTNFLVLLNKWNRIHNLTSIYDLKKTVDVHLLDALFGLGFLKKKINQFNYNFTRIADVGSGNGVPGLIWALADKRLKICLIEKVKKKSAFLNHTIGVLSLQNRVSVLNSDVRSIFDQEFDVVVSRAFSNYHFFLEATTNLSKSCKLWMIMTTKDKTKSLSKTNFENNKFKLLFNEVYENNHEQSNKEILIFTKNENLKTND